MYDEIVIQSYEWYDLVLLTSGTGYMTSAVQ